MAYAVMNRQKNNIARLGFDQRKMVCELLFEGKSYEEIRGVLVGVKLHNSTFQAYIKSQEYTKYCNSRRKFEKDANADRWAADLLRVSGCTDDISDLAEVAVLKQLREIAQSGGMSTGELSRLANSLAALQRGRSKEQKLKEENERLRAALTERRSGVGDLDKVAQELDAALGVR